MIEPLAMTDNKPYLIRAIYEWIVDNNCTPYLVVQASYPGVVVPEQFIEDGKITLNAAPRSVRDLDLGNDSIMFTASFSGVVYDIVVPCFSVAAIFARENAQGMMFEVNVPEDLPEDPVPPSSGGKPTLKVVK